MDLNGDGGMDRVATYEDEYVREPLELDKQGRARWGAFLSDCAE